MPPSAHGLGTATAHDLTWPQLPLLMASHALSCRCHCWRRPPPVQIFERWMQWEPDHHGWMAYIKVGGWFRVWVGLGG